MHNNAANRNAQKIPLPQLLLTVIAVVCILYFASDVLLPFILAILISFMLAPTATRLERWKLGRILSVLIVVGLALALVAGIAWMVERQFLDVASQLPNYRENIAAKLHRLQGSAGREFSEAAKGVEETIKSVATSQPVTQPATTVARPPDGKETVVSLPQDISPQHPLPVREFPAPPSPISIGLQYVGHLLSPLATFGLVVVFVAFILVNREDLRDRAIRLVGHGRLTVTTQAMDDAAARISGFLRRQLLVNTLVGLSISAGLWLVGKFSAEGSFQNALFWGLIAGALRFVPYVGIWIAAAAPILLSLAIFKSAGIVVAVLGIYVLIELVATNVLEPWLFASSTGLSMIAILVAAVFWTWLWGPIGLLISTPVTACLVVLGKHVPQLRFLDVILGDEPVLEPHARVYQRLLALDQEEASDLVQQYRKEKGLLYVYDVVLIPVLAMAKEDSHEGALDEAKEQFVHESIRELVEEFSDGPERASAPPLSEAMVLCLPANDVADEIAGAMLAQLLQNKAIRALAVSQSSLAGEMVDLVERHNAAAVCISALPPAALSHSRYLCKRFRAKFPDLGVIVGLWGSRMNPRTAEERLRCGAPNHVTTSLEQAINDIQEAMHVQIVQSTEPTPPADRRVYS